MKHVLITTFLLLFTALIFAQNLYYKNYDWEQNPVITTPPIEKDEHEVILKDKRAIEFAFENGNFFEFYLKHRIIYIGSEKAIEENNKIYVPSDRIIESIFQKARVVSKDGKITELDEADIKEAKDEDNSNSYKYFALEGVEVGSCVEYLYLVKKSPSYNGKIESFQNGIRRKNISFDIISPNNLYFKTKSFNHFTEAETDTTLENKNRLYFKMAEIPRLKHEESAGNAANCASIIYKLDRNLATGRVDLSNYGGISERIFSGFYSDLSKKITKSLKKIIVASKVETALSTENKIRTLEDYIKTNFGYYEANTAQLSNLESILENKIANENGFVELFCNLLKLMDITPQIVLTSSRNFIKFDPNFEAYNFLQHYLLYFPKQDEYLDPSASALRYGYVPPKYTSTYGLFIKQVTTGGIITGVGEIKFIDALPYHKSTSNLHIVADLTESITDPIFYVENSMTGYYAQNIQTSYELVAEETQEKIRKSLIEYISGKEHLQNLKAKNTSSTDFGKKPFIVSANFTSSNFAEKAGSKVLFKIGQLIGQQTEMYNKDERNQDIESDFNRKYYREITIKLPNNYTLTNPQIMATEVLYKDGKDINAAFISNYTLANNEIKIIVEEYYATINYPKERIEDYKAVINAAADFNKKVLIFEKNEDL